MHLNTLINEYGPTVFVLILSTILFALYAKTRFTRKAIFVNKFPGDRGIPILGNISLLFCGSIEDFKLRAGAYLERHGRVWRFWFFQTPIIGVAQYSAVEKILGSPDHINKSFVYDYIKVYFGEGLITSEANKWRMDRKELKEGMKHNLFQGFLDVFNKHSKLLIDKMMDDVLLQKSSPRSKDMFSIFGQCTLTITCETVLGKKEDSDDCKIDDPLMLKGIETAVNGLRLRCFKPYLCLPGIWNILGYGKMEAKYWIPMRENIISYFNNKLEKKKLKQGEKGVDDYHEANLEKSSTCMMDILLDAEKDRDAQDIFDHAFTMLAAGTDTTAMCMNYTLYLLALNPNEQKKVHSELDNIFSNCEEGTCVTFTDLSQMKYLEMCIKESMRLYPPAPVFSRTVNDDIALDGDLVIPKGCDILILPFELHRDPEVFPQPELFIPERFTAEAVSKRSPYAYIPFSAGIRSCIGQKYAIIEMKVILGHLLRKFSVSTTKKREDLKLIYGIVLEPHGGIPLSFTQR